MIFNRQSCEEELFNNMQQAQTNAIVKEATSKDEIFLKAMQELNTAAEKFESTGNGKIAKEITQLMISLSNNKIDNNKKANKDEVKKVFLFFGFSPEDLEGISSNEDNEDRE